MQETGWFPAWFLFYLLGMDCRRHKWEKAVKESSTAWVIAALILSCGEALVLKRIGCSDGFASSQIKLSSFCYAIAVALLLKKSEGAEAGSDKLIGKGLKMLGDCSYGIYYVHIFVLYAAEKVLYVFGLEKAWFPYFLGTFLLTAIGSLIVVMISKSILLKWNQGK